MSNQRIDYLFLRYYQQSATADEREEFMALVRSEQYKDRIKELILDRLLNDQSQQLSAEKTERILANIIQKRPGTSENDRHTEYPAAGEKRQVRTGRNFPWIRTWAAASVVALVGYFGYKAFEYQGSSFGKDHEKINLVSGIAPGRDRAQLSLSDGTVLNLETLNGGDLLKFNGISNDIVKGELVYQGRIREVGYNTLTTPRGGQYKVILPDGSKAWLNAASSLTYPTEFKLPGRTVEMTGEVYFEIAPDKHHPFYVKVKANNKQNTEIKVLGTHFNVSSYDNEKQMQTTLLEGAVEIQSGKERQILTPGQQAQIKTDGNLTQSIAIRQVDAGSVIAWKEGRFEFNGNIKEIMRQISRWYDVEVDYEGDVENKAFTGTISRKKDVAEVLKMLQLTGGIRFVIDKKKIIVKPF